MDKIAYTSPLMYVGSKRWLFSHIRQYMPPDIKEMVSPFFGGGSMELNIANYTGIKVHGYDICPHLTNFWQHFLINPERLVRNAMHTLEAHTHDSLKALRKDFTNLPDDFMRATLYFLYNRLGLNGMVLASGFVDFFYQQDGIWFKPKKGTQVTDRGFVFPNYFGEKRHGQSYFPLPIENLKRCEINVQCSDFEQSLSNHKDTFAYLDPPYIGTEKMMYGKPFEHGILFDILKSRGKWILSYKDCEEVRAMYKGFDMIDLIKERHRGFRKNGKYKLQHELLIFSHDITPNFQPKQLTLF